MALKPSQITRRNFVQRAGLLVSALGLSGTVHTGLMENITRKASKKWGSDALAQAGTPVKFMVEICFRAGFQFNSLFPSQGHTTAVGNRDPRLNFYSSPANVLSLNRDGKDVYFARYGAGVGGEKLRTAIDAVTGLGIATSEVVTLQTGQHTGNFASRAPNGSAACPAVLHAANAPARPVQGIEWVNGAAVTNQRGSLPALARVQDREQFRALFRELPMYFSREELRLIVGEFNEADGKLIGGKEGALHKIDEMWRRTQDPRSGVYNETDPVVVSSLGGRNQSTLRLVDALDTTFTGIQGHFTGIGNPLGGASVGEALASAASAFARGAASTFTIALDSNDWHGDIVALDTANSKQGQWNTVLGNALAGFIQSAQALQDPEDATKTVLDSTLISLSSEFTRTPLRNGGGSGNDNGDGGTGAFVFIGKMVKNGSFGNIRGTDGGLVGFDRMTGAPGAGNVTEAMVYRTACKLAGLDAQAAGMVAAQPIDAIIK